jgi:hypothetical protein
MWMEMTNGGHIKKLIKNPSFLLLSPGSFHFCAGIDRLQGINGSKLKISFSCKIGTKLFQVTIPDGKSCEKDVVRICEIK